MGAARKLVEKTKELVRALGIYRRKEGEQVREDIRKKTGNWNGDFRLSWTLDIPRICDGRVQIALLLRIFAKTIGAPRDRGDQAPLWTLGLNDEDWGKEIDCARNTAREAVDGAVERGLIARMAADPKAPGRAYYRLRLTPENWPTIADPVPPRKQPERAEASENQAKRPESDGPLHQVKPGRHYEFSKGHRYEFEIAPKVFENYLETPGRLVMNAAGLLRLDPAKAPAEVVQLPVSPGADVANKGSDSQSRFTPPQRNESESAPVRSGPLKRNSKPNFADIPLTVAAIKASGFTHGANFFAELMKRVHQAVVDTGAAEEDVRDCVIAWGVAACQLEKQRSCALFWETVPPWVAAHLHDKAPPEQGRRTKAKSQNEEFAERMLKGEL